MYCYKDRTYCASKDCKNACGRKMTDAERKEASEKGIPISLGNFCGVGRSIEWANLDEDL